MSVAPRSQYVVSSDGARIYAEAHGNPCNPALVLTSGYTLNYICFEKQLALSKALYLVLYDTRGHGRSSMPETSAGYKSSLYAADFKAVCSAFGLDKPVFGGWSLGTTVLVDIVAHLGAEFISGAVLIAGVPHLSLLPEMVNPAISHLLPGIQSTENVAMHKQATLDFGDACFYDPDSVPFPTKMSWKGITMLQPPVVTGLVISREEPSLEVLHNAGGIGLPVLIIRGAEDKHFPSGEVVVKALKPYFGDKLGILELADAGHAVFFEKPEETNAALLEFVLKVKRYQEHTYKEYM